MSNQKIEKLELNYQKKDERRRKKINAPKGAGFSRQKKVMEENRYYQRGKKSAVKLINKL